MIVEKEKMFAVYLYTLLFSRTSADLANYGLCSINGILRGRGFGTDRRV